MEIQKSSSSIPPEWRERFLLKRIGEEDIELELHERNAIINSINTGSRFIQIGKFTIMVNSIKSIDPYYPPDNIPPKPSERYTYEMNGNSAYQTLSNGDEIKLWEQLYNSKEALITTKNIGDQI